MVISEKQVTELEDFFAKANLPKEIELSSGVKITEVSKFLKSHVEVLRNNLDKLIYEVFYHRLLLLKGKAS